MLYTVDLKKYNLLVGVAPIQGYQDGEAFSLELDDDLYQKVTGADGDTSRARRHGQSANLKINLMQTSPSNDILSAYAAADRLNNAGIIPITIADLLGTTRIFGAYGWVKKPPAVSAGKEITTREWMLDIASIELFIGGNFKPLF